MAVFPPQPNAQGVSTSFVVYYSSVDESTGEMWCPDCVRAVPKVAALLDSPHAPDVFIQYVGQRSEWKSPSSPYRAEPYNLTSIPTIVKLEDGVEVSRLADPEFNEEGALAAFVFGTQKQEVVKPLVMVGGNGKVCTDDFCEF
ncbi:hypothetical protein BDY24DRAFT_391524 [Mrakia frigida]|uniref:uncharacterized protein n=1 Tax=Mrakia frigida TaxID=29902 RepID=UPI003FCC2161